MISVVKFLLRILGSFAFAGAVLALISDGSQSIAQNALSMETVAGFWIDLAPSTFETTRQFVLAQPTTGNWGEILFALVSQSPLWVFLCGLGFVMLWLGWSEERREKKLAY